MSVDVVPITLHRSYATSFPDVGGASTCVLACGTSARSFGVLSAAALAHIASNLGLRNVLRRARLLLPEPITHQEVSGTLVGLVQILQSLLYFLHALGSVFRGFFW